MIYNPFRGKRKFLSDKKGFHNPCSYCWRFTCKKCLVFILADFADVLRNDPKLSADFEKAYDKARGHVAITRPERCKIDRNARVKAKQIEKAKKAKLSATKH
jgi:hypothetical protein